MHELDKITLILHLSEKCNLCCKYCYVQCNNLLEENSSIVGVSTAIKKIIDYNGKRGTKIILHGGEPLMVPYTEMDNLLGLLTTYAEEKEYKLYFSMQTNGTLINDEWVRIFHKYKIKIGVSLDGCDEEQNAYRIDGAGRYVFAKVIDRLEFLKQNELKFGVIFTLSKKHIGKEREMLEFIQDKQIKCNIRPAFPTKENVLDQDICMTPKEYSEFFCNMFDIWFNEDKKYETFYVREFEDIIRKILGGAKECHSCVESADCSKRFISMGVKGNCYPCNRLYNNPQFYMGNLIENSIESVMEKGYLLTDRRNEQLVDCMRCDIREFCHGGCPAIAYSVYKDYYERDYFCDSYRYIYAHVKNILNNEG